MAPRPAPADRRTFPARPVTGAWRLNRAAGAGARQVETYDNAQMLLLARPPAPA